MTVSTSGKNHGFTVGGGTNSLASFNDNTVAVADNVTWTRGKHQLIFGGEWIHNQLNINNSYEGNGVFTVNGKYSSLNASGAGDANLDFLQGALSAFQQSKAQQNALRGNIPDLYIQDTYHASARLTLIAGLRWTPTYYPVDYFNRGIEFNMQGFLQNAISSVYTNAPPGVTFYGDPNVRRQFTNNTPNQWSPNIGFAFDPFGDGKTVFRAGFEYAVDQPNYYTSQRNQQNPPYATASSPNTSGQICFSNPWLVGGTGNGCAQVGGNTSGNSYPSPQIPTKASAVFPAQSQYITTVAGFKPMATSMWTASIQHQFGHGWQVQADYIGNRSYHDPIGYPFDDALFIPGVWGAGGTGCSGFATTGPAAIKPGAAGTNCSTTGNYNSRLLLTIANPIGNGVNGGGNQFLGGGAGSNFVNNNAWSDYNGLVLSANHRLSSTFSLLANYTWSKCLDIIDASGDYTGNSVENPNNLRMDYGPCGQDFRNVENVSIVSTSHVKRFDRVFNAILSNWEVAPLFHIQSGAPITVMAGSDISLIDVNKDRPDLIPGVDPYLPSHAFHNKADIADEGYLNPAAFQTVPTAAGCTSVTASTTVPYCPALGTFGNVGKNSFHAPSSFQFDAEISRYFPIHENVKLNFRVEAFNVLNHPNFGNAPNGTPAATTTSFSSNGLTAASSFGLIGSSTSARVFQGALKIIF